jgi:FemAB-related protein (PEP-CTERM system-associated)
MSTPLIVRPPTAQESAPWDQFVQTHPQGTPFHLMAWKKTIETVFGYRPEYRVALEGSRVRGVLPLFFTNSLLTGKALISTPFAVYGGVLADDEEAQRALAAEVGRLSEALGVQHTELRNLHPEQRLGFQPLDRYVTFRQQIGPDEEAMLEAIPRKTRYMVRKALKHPFTMRSTRDVRSFEDLYARNLRRLGTPCFPYRHFTTLLENFGAAADVREVLLDGKVVSAVLSFYFQDQVLPYYGASDPAFNNVAPNNYMYFELMRWGGQNGYRLFDFGRSKIVSGSFDFKAHWGMEMQALPYEMLLVKRKALPDFTPNNPKFARAIQLWQKVPLPICRAIGPSLLKLVP